jgi:hypothetical protein
MSCDQLRQLLENHGIDTKGKKAILVARAEGLFVRQRSPSVVDIATRQALEATPPMLKPLLGSAGINHQRVRLPTESAEVAKLLVCGLFPGTDAMEERLTTDTCTAAESIRHTCTGGGVVRIQLWCLSVQPYHFKHANLMHVL